MKWKWDRSTNHCRLVSRKGGVWKNESLSESFGSRWASKIKINAYYKTMKVFFDLACISNCWGLPKPKYEPFITHNRGTLTQLMTTSAAENQKMWKRSTGISWISSVGRIWSFSSLQMEIYYWSQNRASLTRCTWQSQLLPNRDCDFISIYRAALVRVKHDRFTETLKQASPLP